MSAVIHNTKSLTDKLHEFLCRITEIVPMLTGITSAFVNFHSTQNFQSASKFDSPPAAMQQCALSLGIYLTSSSFPTQKVSQTEETAFKEMAGSAQRGWGKKERSWTNLPQLKLTRFCWLLAFTAGLFVVAFHLGTLNSSSFLFRSVSNKTWLKQYLM